MALTLPPGHASPGAGIGTGAIIARAPLRISFAGGGTDLPAYYESYGGLVLNAAISRAVYAVLAPGDYNQVHLVWSNYRSVQGSLSGHDEHIGSMALPWAVVEAMGLTQGASIFLASEVPQGTGLGSSSTTAAALIRAIATLQQRQMTAAQVAELAAGIEIGHLGQPIGKQDQYATAFGGLNIFAFSADSVEVQPVRLEPSVERTVNAHLALYFTGSTRQASSILTEQRRRTADGEGRTLDSLHRIKAQVTPMRAALEAGDVVAMGALLHDAWTLKRRLSTGVSTGAIDIAYAAAREAGALGGKITGAGGGGFLLLIVPPARRQEVGTCLEALGLREMPFQIDPRGASTIVSGDSSPGGGLASSLLDITQAR